MESPTTRFLRDSQFQFDKDHQSTRQWPGSHETRHRIRDLRPHTEDAEPQFRHSGGQARQAERQPSGFRATRSISQQPAEGILAVGQTIQSHGHRLRSRSRRIEYLCPKHQSRSPPPEDQRAQRQSRTQRLPLEPQDPSEDPQVTRQEPQVHELSSQCDNFPSRSHDHPPLTIYITSYSKVIGMPRSLMPTIDLDVSLFATPKREILNRFTGRDAEFTNTFFNTADHEDRYQEILAEAKDATRAYRPLAKSQGDEVALLVGCHAGMHRSVAVAERLAKDMQEWHGPGVDSVRCLHMDLAEGWLKQQRSLKTRNQPAKS